MIRSGRDNATCADRPSVNNSKRRISFRMLDCAAALICFLKWSVTIRGASCRVERAPGLQHLHAVATGRYTLRRIQSRGRAAYDNDVLGFPARPVFLTCFFHWFRSIQLYGSVVPHPGSSPPHQRGTYWASGAWTAPQSITNSDPQQNLLP